jgi:hypothetical protein
VVRVETAAVLGHSSAGAVPPDQAFKDLGFDSLATVSLGERLRGATGQPVPSTVVYDHPNPRALAAYLRADLAGADAASRPDAPGDPDAASDVADALATASDEEIFDFIDQQLDR